MRLYHRLIDLSTRNLAKPIEDILNELLPLLSNRAVSNLSLALVKIVLVGVRSLPRNHAISQCFYVPSPWQQLDFFFVK